VWSPGPPTADPFELSVTARSCVQEAGAARGRV
jgi:hypothetical protein